MWADNETSEDLLGFKVHAELLINVINDETVLPVTIGVFGDWGSGKSSILQIIKVNLITKRIRTHYVFILMDRLLRDMMMLRLHY